MSIARKFVIQLLLLVLAYSLASRCEAGTISAVTEDFGAVPLGTIRHDRLDSSYLSIGNAFPSVGMVATNDNFFGGSAVLIASDWLLTAAHVVDYAQPLGWSFLFGGNYYNAAAVFKEPTYTGNLYAGNDIALVRLSTPVVGVTPATRYTGTSELGQTASMSGYGATGTGLTGATTYDLLRRGGNNVIDQLGSYLSTVHPGFGTVSNNILLTDFDHPTNAALNKMGSATPLNLEYLIAPGDSGSGMFVDFGSGFELVGINYAGFFVDGTGNSNYGDMAGAIRVSAYNAWIDSHLAAVPEPSTIVLLCMGSTVLFMRRRRRPLE